MPRSPSVNGIDSVLPGWGCSRGWVACAAANARSAPSTAKSNFTFVVIVSPTLESQRTPPCPHSSEHPDFKRLETSASCAITLPGFQVFLRKRSHVRRDRIIEPLADANRICRGNTDYSRQRNQSRAFQECLAKFFAVRNGHMCAFLKTAWRSAVASLNRPKSTAQPALGGFRVAKPLLWPCLRLCRDQPGGHLAR